MIIVRFESCPGVSRGLGDRVKAKTNVATVRLASALGFQVQNTDEKISYRVQIFPCQMIIFSCQFCFEFNIFNVKLNLNIV